jgi:NADH pyrophosphatase NudC (nudix superfamily)
MKEVPKHIKTAMKLITSASDAILKLMLPVTLESVGRLASGSADEANSTLLRFNKLQDLLAEIIELSASNQSTNEADIDRIDEQTHNAYFLIQLSEQNQLAKTMNQMAMLDLNQLSTEVILSLLIKTTEQISLIKEQWARMIQFCSKLASQAYSTKQVRQKSCFLFLHFVLLDCCKRFR